MFQDGGCFSYVNPELIRMMGFENDDPIVGRPFWEFIHPDDRDIGFKRRSSPGIEIALYRIFQESVNNILKHSGAHEIDIRLTCSHPNVIFSCRDNGHGFETGENGFPKDDTMGIGLLSMQESADALNGKFEIRSVRDKGTMIRVEIPIQEEG